MAREMGVIRWLISYLCVGLEFTGNHGPLGLQGIFRVAGCIHSLNNDNLKVQNISNCYISPATQAES